MNKYVLRLGEAEAIRSHPQDVRSRVGQFLDQPLHALGVPRAQPHTGAFGDQPSHHSGPQPVRAPRDQHDLVRQFQIRDTFLSSAILIPRLGEPPDDVDRLRPSEGPKCTEPLSTVQIPGLSPGDG